MTSVALINADFLRGLFYGKGKRAEVFNYVLLSVNLLVFAIFPLEAIYPDSIFVTVFEISFAAIFSLEYAIRLYLAPKKRSYIFNIFSLIDLLVIISLIAPTFIGNAAILRIFRALRIARSYHIIKLAQKKYSAVMRYRDIVYSLVNFFVFLFMVTAVIFVSQESINENINTYIDALYFTVATLTTTGYGDIIAVGTFGKALVIIAMIVGISLFFKLAQAVVKGPHARVTCPACGLDTHDLDASHCKHCGHVINIKTHGFA